MTTPQAQPVAATVGPPGTARIADELKAQAPQAALRGEHGRALDLYRALTALEPTVPLHRVRAGDCLVKLGRKREALVEYRSAAETYTGLSLVVHARSAWRLVLGIAPGDRDAAARLAALDARTVPARPADPPRLPPVSMSMQAPPPPAGAPSSRARARREETPTSPESLLGDVSIETSVAAQLDAEPSDDTRTAVSVKAPRRESPEPVEPIALPAASAPAARALGTTPVVPRRADVRSGDDPTASRKALGLEALAKGEELMPDGTFCPATGEMPGAKTAVAPAPAVAPAAKKAVVPAAPPSLERSLEFADLDDDDDTIFIDLDPVLDAQRRADDAPPPVEEPVAFFAERSEPEASHPESSAIGPRSSLVEEQTKPVAPPDDA